MVLRVRPKASVVARNCVLVVGVMLLEYRALILRQRVAQAAFGLASTIARLNVTGDFLQECSMVKPYCEDCGKHRGSCNGYCCDAESKRVRDGAIKFYKFSVLAFVVVMVLWIVYFG